MVSVLARDPPEIAECNHCYKMMMLTGAKEAGTLEFYRSAGYNSSDRTAFIQVGVCWEKANLPAALLRACNIPAGICYQRLTLGDTPETGFCIHALNAVYIKIPVIDKKEVCRK